MYILIYSGTHLNTVFVTKCAESQALINIMPSACFNRQSVIFTKPFLKSLGTLVKQEQIMYFEKFKMLKIFTKILNLFKILKYYS